MALDTRLHVSLVANATSPLDLVSVTAPLNFARNLLLASGTGVGQADKIFSDQRSIAASGTDDLDLAGVLTDAFNDVITFAKIKVILIAAAASNINSLVVGGAATNPFLGPFADATDRVTLLPGGLYLHTAPGATAYPVTADTADLLRVANGGAGSAVKYEIVLIGTSA